ncbi:BCCT family transporter [Gammaproteobacteria bacterium]|nr:BCCT family transporter [Gammaproteobacteria bacterium]
MFTGLFNTKIRKIAFFFPLALLIPAIILLKFYSPDLTNLPKDTYSFDVALKSIVQWMLIHFSWAFNLSSFLLVVISVALFVSPIGKVKIGGENAIPMVSKGRWFSITLCTTVAAGILFWAAAESLYHYYNPAISANIAAKSPQAIIFSLSSMFLHWSFTPYAIYTVCAILFALSYYNLNKPFSISSMLYPLFGERVFGKTSQWVDGLVLFSLVAGMSASLGTGVLAIAGGLDMLFNIKISQLLVGLITLSIVITFVISSASGVNRGIALLSKINIYIFGFICLFVFICGPTLYILDATIEGFGNYLNNFIEKSLRIGTVSNDTWSRDWSVFFFANWMTWAPITAMFLAKISRGYTVREFIMVSLVAPSIFSIMWVGLFGSSSLYFDILSQGEMHAILIKDGYQAVIYAIFARLPWSILVSVLFIFATFISFVTAADSNTDAMSRICSADEQDRFTDKGDLDKSTILMKILWGSIIGLITWIMVGGSGIEGVKTLSYLGGFPALVLIILVVITMFKILFLPKSKRLFRSAVASK